MFIPFKKFDEVTAIVETAVVGDGGNGGIGSAKHGTGVFDSVIIQVIHRCLMGNSVEVPAKIFWRHS